MFHNSNLIFTDAAQRGAEVNEQLMAPVVERQVVAYAMGIGRDLMPQTDH
jgi:hypothetical protein